MKTNINKSQLIQKRSVIKTQTLSYQIKTQIFYQNRIKNKPSLIFLHGGPGWPSYQLKYAFKQLGYNFPVIFYDQILCGMSKITCQQINQETMKKIYTIQYLVKQLQQVIKYYKLQKFYLFGVSWGGTLALQYFLKNYQFIQKKLLGLIFFSPLINTQLWINDVNILINKLPKNVKESIFNKDQDSRQYKRSVAQFNNKFVLKNQLLKQNQQFISLNKSLNSSNNQIYQYMWGKNQFNPKGTLKNYDRLNQLQKINVPNIWVCGQNDQVRIQTIQKYSYLAKGSNKTIQQSSHFCYLQKPQICRQIILQFYNNNLQN